MVGEGAARAGPRSRRDPLARGIRLRLGSCSVENMATGEMAAPENLGTGTNCGKNQLRVQTPNSETARNLVSVPQPQFEPVMRSSLSGCEEFSTEQASPRHARTSRRRFSLSGCEVFSTEHVGYQIAGVDCIWARLGPWKPQGGGIHVGPPKAAGVMRRGQKGRRISSRWRRRGGPWRRGLRKRRRRRGRRRESRRRHCRG